MAEAGPLPAGASLADLQALGAHRVDPARFAYLAALSRRSAAQHGAARQALDARLAQALDTCAADCRQALAEARQALPGLLARHPAAAPELRRLLAQADLPGLRRLAARLDARGSPGPLAGLVQQLDRTAPGLATGAGDAGLAGAAGPATQAAPAGELRALRQFRRTWTRLSAEQQLLRSQAQLPQNPGPLNSQLLALRALQLMQVLSPAYLQRFMAQIEALLWLDEAGPASAAANPERIDPLRALAFRHDVHDDLIEQILMV